MSQGERAIFEYHVAACHLPDSLSLMADAIAMLCDNGRFDLFTSLVI